MTSCSHPPYAVRCLHDPSPAELDDLSEYVSDALRACLDVETIERCSPFPIEITTQTCPNCRPSGAIGPYPAESTTRRGVVAVATLVVYTLAALGLVDLAKAVL